MGLDMYLEKKIYIGNNFRTDDETVRVEVPESRNTDHIKINDKKIVYIIEEVAYWRKVNHIHRWFVENVQGGHDNCREYYVSEDQFKKLLDTIDKILNNRSKAPELMPVQHGFFFGGTEYDEYYFEELQRTKDILHYILNDDSSGEYYYSSSW